MKNKYSSLIKLIGRSKKYIHKSSITLLLLSFLSCQANQPSNTTLTYKEDLFEILQNQNSHSYTTQFLLIYQLNQILLKEEKYQEALSLLSEYNLNLKEEDPFQIFYYYLLGENYEKDSQPEVAILYYETLLREFSDIKINNNSLHKEILEKLILLDLNPFKRKQYNSILLEKFLKEASPSESALWLYRMGTILEEIGEFEKAIGYYDSFLKVKEIGLPDSFLLKTPNLYEKIQNKIMFHYSSKDWIVPNLNLLINRVKESIKKGDTYSLNRLRNPNSFFIKTWAQELGEEALDTDNTENLNVSSNNEMISFFSTFLSRGPYIKFQENLDSGSSQELIYLGSSGWDRISTWYFVFQQVDYPLDPELNNSWEWIGIYLGEKP